MRQILAIESGRCGAAVRTDEVVGLSQPRSSISSPQRRGLDSHLGQFHRAMHSTNSREDNSIKCRHAHNHFLSSPLTPPLSARYRQLITAIIPPLRPPFGDLRFVGKPRPRMSEPRKP